MRRDGSRTHHGGVRRRFTLLELLLAFVVLVVVLMVISLSFRAVVASWRGMARSTARAEEQLRLTDFADEYLRRLAMFKFQNSNGGGEEVVFVGNPGSVYGCVISAVQPDGSGGIVYFKTELSESGDLVLSTARAPLFPDIPADVEPPETKAEVIASKVAKVEFSYAGLEDGDLEFQDEWLPDEEGGLLPVAVLMKVEWENGTSEVWLRRLAGAQEYVLPKAQGGLL
ncbi:MAG: hypothetical protein AB7F40_06820 [Victivallaceae bacterium]|nr:hypothetical protein [Victivallaceae bacterium]